MRLSFFNLNLQIFFRVFVIGIILHEVGHILALAAMGIPGAYYSFDLNHVYALEALTEEQSFIFGIGGGLVAGIFFAVLNFDQSDPENNLANTLGGYLNLIYGVGEAVFPPIFWNHASLIATLIAGAIVLQLVIKKKPEWVL